MGKVEILVLTGGCPFLARVLSMAPHCPHLGYCVKSELLGVTNETVAALEIVQMVGCR